MTNPDFPSPTTNLVTWLTNLTPDSIPASVTAAAQRALYNYLGCTLHGTHHATFSRALSAVTPFSGPPTSSLFGTPHRTDAPHAALLNSIASHIHDYDDTHLETIIHPASPVASALLAYIQYLSQTQNQRISGSTLLTALIAGIEVECKLGKSVYPRHYNAGWHITSTTGSIGAAASLSILLALTPSQTAHALGIAASQVTGLRCNFGSDTKCFHVGRAAQNGLLAASLAKEGFTAGEGVIEAERGWANVVTGGTGCNEDVRVAEKLDRLIGELGTVWETERNSFKPFPCGIVAHPGIDAAVRMRGEIYQGWTAGGDWNDEKERERKDQNVEDEFLTHLTTLTFTATVHPLVIELTNKKTPRDGLEAKFSVYHGIAVGLVYGKAGPAEYEDHVVNDPKVVRVRGAVEVVADEGVGSDEAVLRAFKGGRHGEPVFSVHVEHAVGSIDVPMTDKRLQEKFVDQVSLDVGLEEARRLSALCWGIGEVDDVDVVLRQLGGKVR